MHLPSVKKERLFVGQFQSIEIRSEYLHCIYLLTSDNAF
jgi:hypothetical protein